MNQVEKTARTVDRFQQRRPWLAFPVAVWKKFGDDRAGNLAGLIAFFGFASVFPLLLVLVTILDITMRNYPGVKESLEHSALAQFPVIGQEIGKQVHSISGRGVPLAMGVIFTLFGSRGIANAMQNALNEVWGVPLADRPRFPWNVLRSLGLIAVVGGGLIVTGALSGLAAGAGHVVTGVGALILATAVSLVLNVGVFLLAFRLATAKDVSWRNLRVGAVLAAIVWQVLLSLGTYFVNHQLHHSSSLYGTFAVVLGLMTWLYLEAQATLYAAEVNVVLVKHLWPRALVTPPYTKADREAQLMYAQATKRDRGEVINVSLIPEQGEQVKGSHERDEQQQRR
jgi:YihY family inner membrane protein